MQPTTVPVRSPDPPPAATLPHVPFRLDDHSDMPDASLSPLLERIAAALERMVPPPAARADLTEADAFVWEARAERLRAVPRVAGVPYDLLCGIERVAETLHENTRRFADGLPANNALLWGARGMGKSSLVKAIHARLNERRPGSLVLIEIHREDIESLPRLLHLLAGVGRRCPPVLRRPVVRCRRDQLQVAEGGTRRRHRRQARQRPALCHLQPAPSHAASDDRQ